MEPASSEKDLYKKEETSGGDGHDKVILVLLVAAVCLSFAAFIIGIVSLTHRNQSSSPSVVNVGK